MKFLVLSALITSVLARALYIRDLDTIKSVLSDVGNNLDGLANSVTAFTGDARAVVDAANTLTKTLDDGKAKVEPSDQLSLGDALGLQQPVKDLQSKADALLSDFKAAKDKIAANNLCDATYQQAVSINTKSNDLINTVTSKVPQAAQDIAKQLCAGLVQDLQDAQDEFSPENCQNTGA